MNFEKRMKKRGNQKLNKFAKNPYRVPWFKRIPTWVKIAAPSLVAATAMAVVVVVTLPYLTSTNGKANLMNGISGSNYKGSWKDADAHAPAEASTSQAMSSYIDDPAQSEESIPWDNRSINQKYPSFIYNNVTYSKSYIENNVPIDNQYVDEKVADVSVSGYDSNTDSSHQSQAEIYSIKNIAHDVGLAIKFVDQDSYYAYLNQNCYFANIGELLDKVSFASEVELPTARYTYRDSEENAHTTIYENINKDSILSLVFDDRTIANQVAAPQPLRSSSSSSLHHEPGDPSLTTNTYVHVRVTIRIPSLSINNGYFVVYSNGVMDLAFTSRVQTFAMGETRKNALLTYLNNNATIVSNG